MTICTSVWFSYQKYHSHRDPSLVYCSKIAILKIHPHFAPRPNRNRCLRRDPWPCRYFLFKCQNLWFWWCVGDFLGNLARDKCEYFHFRREFWIYTKYEFTTIHWLWLFSWNYLILWKCLDIFCRAQFDLSLPHWAPKNKNYLCRNNGRELRWFP